ncbi:hypothetical protein BT93_L1551 [Corymbia citriodora subsp. variegata]|uniref:Peptidase A1 domain-containing protein n=1 Tax=Corymbia citriodora subsp. variegata TaxID=360336 RepID=A0A8T0CSA5_CORYI|nr:hypothetical protein BT93_L1551 [Corymbia citriodora subsp. variegata]
MAALYLHNRRKTLVSFALLSLVFSLDDGYAQTMHHQVVNVSSLLPSASCTPSSPTKPNVLNHTKILVEDQSRVNSIRSKISMSSSNNTNKGGSLGGSKATVLAKLGISFDLLEPSKITLILDTGSDLTWTQCKPCSFCYPQSEPIFDPSDSWSYVSTPCTSPVSRGSGSGISTSCSGSTCNYLIFYSDLSLSSGKLVTEALTLTSMDVIENFQFGCGGFNCGHFGEVAGVLGLARDGLSIVGKTVTKYGQYFSYCLPSSSSSTGFLAFGKTSETPKSSTFTLIATIHESSLFYGIKIVEITVAGTKLQIPSTVFLKARAIIVSGTVITRLPPKAYNAMRTAFQKEMVRYKRAKSFEILETCYDLHNTNDDIDIIIYGNVQQKTFEVIYDVAGG